MVKKGPCCHCGTMEAVMWRKGPEDKPVLCNPCGARWISKKSLEGYMPMSAGGIRKSSKAKTSGHKNTKSKQAGQANGVNTSTLSRNKLSVLDGKRSRKKPQKYADEPSDKATNKRKKTEDDRKRGHFAKVTTKGLKITLKSDKFTKGMDRIPSPHKPAKKRHTMRNLFLDENLNYDTEDSTELVSPTISLPPKKKQNNVLKSFPYLKRTVLHSFESPLCYVDLSSIIRPEIVKSYMNEEDMKALRDLLPTIDKALLVEDKAERFPFFSSSVFKSALVNFQTLLKSGSFDVNFPQSNLRMVEHYNRLMEETDLSSWRKEKPENVRRRSRAATQEVPQEVQKALSKLIGVKVEQVQEFEEVIVNDIYKKDNINANIVHDVSPTKITGHESKSMGFDMVAATSNSDMLNAGNVPLQSGVL